MLKSLLFTTLIFIGPVISGTSVASTAKAKCDTKPTKVRCPRANLYGVNFSGRNLTGANFTNANLERAVFRNANLTGADFTGAKLGDAVFAGATLDKAKLRAISYYGDPWKNAKSMRGAIIDGLVFRDLSAVDFSGASLTNVAFVGNLSRSRFVNTRFDGQQVSFSGGDLMESPRDSIGNLDGTDFTGAIFNTKLFMFTAVKGSIGLSVSDLLKFGSWLNLSGLDLTGVDFTVARAEAGIDLVDVNLTEANLNGRWLGGGQGKFGGSSTIARASLKGARIGGTQDWSKIDGSPSTLEGATFDFDVSLTGVKWDGVNLSGADLRNVRSLEKASIRNSNLSGILWFSFSVSQRLSGADFTGSTTSNITWPRVDGLFTCPSGQPSNSRTGC